MWIDTHVVHILKFDMVASEAMEATEVKEDLKIWIETEHTCQYMWIHTHIVLYSKLHMAASRSVASDWGQNQS